MPVDIKRIAHLEREVMLDAQAGDWTEVAVLNANAQAVTWARLRPFVLQRPGGASRAAEVDEAFADLLEAIDEEDAEDAIEAAEDVIEAVEDLVVLF